MYKKKRIKALQISKEAFLWLQDLHRQMCGFAPLSPKQKVKLWERAVKYAPAATETHICIRWNESDINLLERGGHVIKLIYI